ncbi:unnamed protein product [Scytosiphon promiscuus]
MPQEPEVAHPFSRGASTSSLTGRVSSAEKAHAKSLRNAGKEAFLSVVRETVAELGLEAANLAVEEETARMEGMHKRERSGGGSSRSHGRPSSRNSSSHDMVQAPYRPGLGASQDSASGSPFRSAISPRNSSGGSRRSGLGGEDLPQPKERRRRRNRNSSMAQGEGQSIVAAAMAAYEGGIDGSGDANPGAIAEEGWDGSRSMENVVPSPTTRKVADAAAAAAVVAAERGVVTEEDGTMPFRDTADAMEDDERETLLALLSGAYGQVNDLTDELKMSLDKLNDTEKELKAVTERERQQRLMPKPSPKSDLQLSRDAVMDDSTPTRKPAVSNMLKGMFPTDEGSKSTPAAVRQLQVEVQRLRQRNAQAHAKEEKYKSDISHMQRLMSVMEAQSNKAEKDGALDSNGSASRSHPAKQPPAGAFYMTSGGTRYQDGVTKPLVARVAELEEKLVKCSMENATAKQEHLAAQLNGQKLEKTLRKLRHDLAKSRAMNDLLQNEIDRLQGRDPEGEADGSGWRRWLGGLQEPLSPDPDPIQVSGDSDSPVVVVRDLDNNQLVYAPGRSDFM